MQRMQRQAQQTDAAIQRLGRNLDHIGSRNQASSLGQTERQLRAVRTEGDRVTDTFRRVQNTSGGVGRALRTMNRDTDSASRGFRKAKQESEGFTDRLIHTGAAIMAVGKHFQAMKLPAMVAGVGFLVQAVSSLAGGVVTLLPQLTDLVGVAGAAGGAIAGVGLAMVTVKLATHGLSQAMGGNKKALQQLTPEARKFITTLKEYAPVMKELRSSAQRGLFPGLTSALTRAQRGVPMARGLLRAEGNAIGSGVSRQVERFTTDQNLANLGTIGREGVGITQRGITAFGNLAAALIQVTLAARPFTNWLVNVVVHFTHWLAVWTRVNRESGRLGDFFNRTRQSMTIFGHIILNVLETFRGIGHAARATGDSLWREADRATRGWARFAQSFGGQMQMTRFFESTRQTVRQTIGLISDLAGAVFRMGNQPGIADNISHLRAAVPAIEKTLNTFVSTFIPALIDLLTQVVRILNLITVATGPINILLRLVTGILRVFNDLTDSSKALRSVFTTLFSVVTIGLFVRRIAMATRGMLGLAAATNAVAVAEGSTAVMGGAAAAAGGGAAARTVLRRGGAVVPLVGGAEVAAGLGGAAAVARSSRLRALAGRGLRMVRPLAFVAAGAGMFTAQRSGGFEHQLHQVAAGGLNTLSLGGYGAAMHSLFGDKWDRSLMTPGQIAQRSVDRTTDQLNAAGGMNPASMSVAGHQIGILRQGIAALKVENTDASRAAIAGLQAEIALRERAIRTRRDELNQVRRGRAIETAHRLLPSFGREFNYLADRNGVVSAGQQTATDILARMQKLPESGRAVIAHSALVWAAEAARQNPKLQRMYEQLRDGVLGSFREMHRNVRLFNNQILTGSRDQWQAIGKAMEDPLVHARIVAEQQFTFIQQKAVAALQAMGFSGKNAGALVMGIESGRVAPGNVKAGASPGALLSPHATGGRIGGHGLRDTVPLLGTNTIAAPGELIVNRHTEHRVNTMLGGSTTLGRLVAGETTPHYAATGGRAKGLQPGIASLAGQVLGAFPGLAITSTTGGKHAKGSYHYRGLAVDIGGPADLMNRAAAWIGSNMGGSLIEGIHNPNLSISNGRPVSPGFWGASTWAGHANHIHLAAVLGSMLGLPGGGMGGALGVPPIAYNYMGGGGIAGALSHGAGRSMARAMRAHLASAMSSPTAGWHRNGLDTVVNRPTTFGAGEGGPERVTITPIRKRGGGGGMVIEQLTIHHSEAGDTYHQAMDEFHKAWRDFSSEIGFTESEV